MNKLKLLNNMGFKISWKLINMGLYGYDEIPVTLNRDDVIEYLYSLLIDTNEQTDNIINLICEKEDTIEFDRLLKEYANDDDSNTDIQKRKWRVYLLKRLMENISKDSLQGLLELMEFWISMGNPDDCPITFPISGDKKSVQDYFSQTSYDFNVDKTCEWLNEEISVIVKLEA